MLFFEVFFFMYDIPCGDVSVSKKDPSSFFISLPATAIDLCRVNGRP